MRGTLVTLIWLLAPATACTSESSNPGASAKKATTTKNAATGQDTAKKHDAGTATTTKIDRSGVADVGTDGPLDYADRRMWLCRPGNDPDECDANLDATELLPDGSQRLVKHVKAENPTFDCFYVYPTVKLDASGPMTDFANIDITLDPLLAQAARFNRICRMYAPLYRQNGIAPTGGGAPPAGGSFNLGAGDVRDAFKYYLDHLSEGRKFVLMGHSQGTGMVTAMMVQDVDPNPEVRAKLISALLLGGSVTVPDGQDVGGTFQNIPICTKPRQVGCAMTYASFSKEVPPSATGGFGSSTQTGRVAACTEPAALADRAGQRYSGSYVALNLVNKTFIAQGIDQLPSVDTSYILYRDVFRGECKSGSGRNYLEVSLEMAADDPRPPFPYHFPGLESGLGLHLVDYALELDDLIEDVRLQAEAAGD